jgi:hypothetical protein
MFGVFLFSLINQTKNSSKDQSQKQLYISQSAECNTAHHQKALTPSSDQAYNPVLLRTGCGIQTSRLLLAALLFLFNLHLFQHTL